MRSKLQYAYTIGVFFGVLVTSYMMISRDSSGRLPLASSQAFPLRSEATMVDPAVESLFQMEDQLSRLRKEKDNKIDNEKRTPTQQKPFVFPAE